MERRTLGIAMNGVTGRMGTNQHLIRSILAIRQQGGVPLPDGGTVWPDPVLVGRNEAKLRALAEAHGLDRWTTDLDACLADPDLPIYFDAQTTTRRAAAVRAAIGAGKHVYCEKPVAEDLATACELARLARAAGVRHGVVADKLFLPGMLTLRRLLDEGFFGRVLAVRGEFGYWVFEGHTRAPQRPSWNYRVADGGGIILDMFAHWRYLLEGLFGPVTSVSAVGATHVPERVDERGVPYRATAEDAAYATFTVGDGIVVQLNSSWCTRVNRDELLVLHVDGTEGSAVAGLRTCRIQPRAATPRPVWNPDIPDPIAYRDGWQEVPGDGPVDNAFKAQWERFLRHVASGEPWAWGLDEAAKGVQLAELAMRSWKERRWLDVPALDLRPRQPAEPDGAQPASEPARQPATP
jgi:predicted dehydrogenase